ncbi:MAG: DUF3343 domain-containing protein [Fastidiosipilaceae bacterium]|jgi:hypothetical protein|nr:DUF3343 domain-containing protein [Clostridiaceae bacterium]
MRFIITFATVTDALAVEAYAAENELGGEIIALPGSLKAGCGFAYQIVADGREKLVEQLSAGSLNFEAIVDWS